MEQKRLTLKEFAKEVNYSERQISRYISSGKLFPRRNLSGRCYFLLDDVKKFNDFTAIDESSFLDLTLADRIKKAESVALLDNSSASEQTNYGKDE